MTIFKRLTIGYVSIMIMVLFMGSYAWLKLKQINRIYAHINQVEEASIEIADRLSDALLTQISFGKKFLVSRDRDFYRQFMEIGDQIAPDMQSLSALVNIPEKRRTFEEMAALHREFSQRFEKAMELPIKREAAVLQLEQSWDTTTDAINQRLRKLVLICRSEKNQQLQLSGEVSSQVLKVTGFTAVLIILTGTLVSFLNTRTINRSILRLQQKTKEIARGRFEEISSIVSPPEIKDLADHFNAMCRRLKELEEMKIDFITHISHELRTPLTAIKEASSMLLEKVYANSPKKQHELLVITQEECERLIKSVNRILDLARMEARMMPFNFRECPLDLLIRKSITKIGPIALTKKIRFGLKLPPVLPPVLIDDQRVEQVFENILGNALKFSPRNGSVVISASLSKPSAGFIQISITDTGPGIPAGELSNIFDKFHRIENGIETARGSGLGLSIVKHIISSHGGTVWVKSTEGKGCTFYFTLPVFSSHFKRQADAPTSQKAWN